MKQVTEVNEFFVKSVVEIPCNISATIEQYDLTHRITGNPNSFYFHKIQDHSVMNAVSSMRSNVTCSDEISLCMLKLEESSQIQKI